MLSETLLMKLAQREFGHISLAEMEMIIEERAELLAKIAELMAPVQTVREATSPACGWSLPPDDDCYGCQSDRLRETLIEEKEQED